MDIQDLMFVDINELGIRPNWIEDENELDYEQDAKNRLGNENIQENFILNKTNSTVDITMSEDDETNYQVDPETGNYAIIFSSFCFDPNLLTQGQIEILVFQ